MCWRVVLSVVSIILFLIPASCKKYEPPPELVFSYDEQSYVSGIQFSPDGKLFATASDRGISVFYFDVGGDQ